MDMPQQVLFEVIIQNRKSRFMLPTHSITWTTLCAVVQAKFNLKDNHGLLLFYWNSRSFMTVSNAEELTSVLSQLASGVIHLCDNPWNSLESVGGLRKVLIDSVNQYSKSSRNGSNFEEPTVLDDDDTLYHTVSNTSSLSGSVNSEESSHFASAFGRFERILDTHRELVYNEPESIVRMSHVCTLILANGTTIDDYPYEPWLNCFANQTEMDCDDMTLLDLQDLVVLCYCQDHVFQNEHKCQQLCIHWDLLHAIPPLPFPSMHILPQGPVSCPVPLPYLMPICLPHLPQDSLLFSALKTMGCMEASPPSPSKYLSRFYASPLHDDQQGQYF